MDTLKNKRCIVTGAGSGIGKAITMSLLSAGANVLATDIRKDRLEELGAGSKQLAGKLETLPVDMGKPEDIDRMFDHCKMTLGGLDVLVNNAGLMDDFSPVGEVKDALWQTIMDVNVTGPMQAMRHAVKGFLEQRHGNIINIASIGGVRGARAGAAYTASKHALVGLTKNTAYMYSKSGIRCNAVAPGGVETNITESLDMAKISPLAQQQIFSATATNPRTGKPQEIAEIVLFLASDRSSFINGDVIVADAGWTAF
ncbi:MAG: SDR family oxidoreductase [Flavobacteriales bacterium]|jgi:NAD(P)-dependent dehydrogenase (short-subunit alcohol dehydrogenase family)|nr:SDR family oxidoreductase [Flavobacteriales bacterium]MBK6893707.1 SDR family oxidoreductase [Flavobacteriales bacterium]MBK7248582.1 SDR family oxidoreductase [Flavobacteriales bacterium]MBK7287738.1 SDR family oxidoreductase [Flavobacteriales bacterium]MBK9597869.1 SDR family oxidoreductase [Flavobacteriales bacterium]